MQKILIVRFSSIGDIVLTTPVIRCLKLQTGAYIAYLTKESYLPLLEENPYLDKVFTIQARISEVGTLLKAEKFDVIIDLHKNLRSWQLRMMLQSRCYSFHKLNLKKWLLVRLKIDRLPNVHIVDRYLNAVRPLGVKNDGKGLDYFLPESLTMTARPLKAYWVVVVGAAHATKRIPVNKLVEICSKTDLPIVLVGGKAEKEAGDKIVALAGSHVENRCGQLNLHASANIIRFAAKVLTPDTGMMHIAAAFQKEIIVVWGSTVPSFGMYPYFGKKRKEQHRSFEVVELSCRPCSKIGFKQCPKGHFRCMNDQDTHLIAQAMQSVGADSGVDE